jgi:hypothetical protein
VVKVLEPYCTHNKILGRFYLSQTTTKIQRQASTTTKIQRRCVFSHRRNPTKTIDYQDPAASHFLPLQESYNQDPAVMRVKSSSQPQVKQ